MPDDNFQLRKLESVLKQNIAGFTSLKACEQLTAGASQETYRIQLATEQGELILALRRNQSAMNGEAIPGQIRLTTEARLLQLAKKAGIPVPAVVHVLQPEEGLGEAYLMEWLEGETLGQRIVRSEKLATVRPVLARQCGEALGRVHTIELSDELKQLLPTTSPEALVIDTWNAYKALEVSEPMIDFTARWLLQNIPTDSRISLVHGDFRNGNLMIDQSGVRAVLDWELAKIGDPVRDLGWLCVNSWRFGKTDFPVGGFGAVEDLLEGYKSVTGIDVSACDLTFWQVFGSFWWSITTISMAATWRTGETPSLERPVIGRRSSEAQMDCVNLIIPGDYSLPAPKALTEGSQLPMPAELLEGVGAFLKNDVAAMQSGRSSFLAKVAANSLGIAQRELLHGPVLAEAEKARLKNIVGDGTLQELRWKLVHSLRGNLSIDDPALAEHLRETVAGQLAIDQPGYASSA